MATTETRRKTSFEIDFAKVDAARAVLGTKTLTETVDRALDEVVNLQLRRQLVEILSTPNATDLTNAEIMADAWR